MSNKFEATIKFNIDEVEVEFSWNTLVWPSVVDELAEEIRKNINVAFAKAKKSYHERRYVEEKNNPPMLAEREKSQDSNQ